MTVVMATGRQRGKSISTFFTTQPVTEIQNANDSLQPPCPKCSKVKEKSKEETTTPTDRVFQKSWLIDFEWLRYDGVATKMHCQICRNAGSKLAGNTDFVAGSENFKRENVRIWNSQ